MVTKSQSKIKYWEFFLKVTKSYKTTLCFLVSYSFSLSLSLSHSRLSSEKQSYKVSNFSISASVSSFPLRFIGKHKKVSVREHRVTHSFCSQAIRHVNKKKKKKKHISQDSFLSYYYTRSIFSMEFQDAWRSLSEMFQLFGHRFSHWTDIITILACNNYGVNRRKLLL